MPFKKAVVLATIFGVLFIAGRWLHMQIAYAEIEQLTREHSGELSGTVRTFIINAEFPGGRFKKSLEYFKIFEYSATNAKVYLVARIDSVPPDTSYYDRNGGFLYLLFQNGAWILDPSRPYDMKWSRLGSADEEVWPPYY
jgi:hypothetical protein